MTERVWTIGYGGRDVEDFVTLLQTHKIATVVDVRSRPHGWNPAYHKDNLANTLDSVGIGYVWSQALGGYEFTDKTRLKLALKRALLQKAPVCLMCAEEDHHKCHRYTLLAPLVIEMGHPLAHISKGGRVYYQHKPAPKPPSLDDYF